MNSDSAGHILMSDSLRPHGLYPISFLCPRNSPGKNTRVGCHPLLQGIFLTQGSKFCLLHCRQNLYYLSHQQSRDCGKSIDYFDKDIIFLNYYFFYCSGFCHTLKWKDIILIILNLLIQEHEIPFNLVFHNIL